MKSRIDFDEYLGRLLWLSDGNTDLAVTLDTGLRVVHLSSHNMENLFYRQPGDLSDGFVTKEGWRLIGGHRFWLAPESEKSYWPENAPVEFELEENAVKLTQSVDSWLQVQKKMRLEFKPDGTILVEQEAVNLSEKPLTCALWGVNTLCGGRGEVEFSGTSDDEYNPSRVMSLWGSTSLQDTRMQFREDKIIFTKTPSEKYFKIGVYSAAGRLHHENLGQSLDISIPVAPMQQCADGGCNVEIFLHRCFMELETLGSIVTIRSGFSAKHTEIWRVKKLDHALEENQ